MPGRFSLFTDLTVEENLQFYATIFGTTIKENYHLIEPIYRQIEPFKKRRAGQLSGGMKQKLLIAIAIAKNPEIFIFDEPTANLDPKGRENFYEIMKEYNKNRLIIFISHRIEEVLNLVNRKIELDLGKVILDEKI